MIISWLAHYIFKLLCGIQAWTPSPSDNSPRAGRLGINEVAATIGGGGGQIKPLVGEDAGEHGSLAYNRPRGYPVSVSLGRSVTHVNIPLVHSLDKCLRELIPSPRAA